MRKENPNHRTAELLIEKYQQEKTNTAIIPANFGKTARTTICADGGSDINAMPEKLLKKFATKIAKIAVTAFKRTKMFRGVSQKSCSNF